MDFLKAIEAERDRIDSRIEQLNEQRDKISEEIEALQLELEALSAYEAAKEGKKPVKKTRSPRKSGIRQAVMNTIASHPNGISRSDILDVMNAKGNKSAEQSISNALAALKKSGQISGEGGVYAKT